jgi:chemotaxis protein methyltransferase CheR
VTITTEQFTSLTSLLKQETAVVVSSGKEYLVEARLSQVAMEEGYPSIADLVDYTLRFPYSPTARKVLLALTTAETSFFRDVVPFDALHNTIVPSLLQKRAHQRTLSIWSIGCASGQEVYSVAMLLAEHFSEWDSWNIRIVGSDINPKLLAQAESGRYSHLEVNRGLPAKLLVTYFNQVGGAFQVCDRIRSRVSFVERNILEAWSPFEPDIILCRNTLIYFDLSTRKRIVGRLHAALSNLGYLLMGTAEGTRHLHAGFSPVQIPGANVFIKTASRDEEAV